ncbi:MAG TPA: ATP-grasp domain-containing protein [Bacteroidales bacterium]|nr:ATP-grasp domain-containing protein [Bacteroidales bacterium]
MKRVLVLINELSDTPSPDEQDVLDQANIVEETLVNLGYDTVRSYMGLDLAKTRRNIVDSGADIVFNLVESIDNKAELIHLPPALLQSMRVPFTGSGAEAMFLTSNKQVAKSIMLSNGIATPKWYRASDSWQASNNRKYIVKPVFEDASVGIDDNSVFNGKEPEKLVEYGLRFGKNFFVEEFIEGREFNLSIIAGDDGPSVLPPAEIIFTNYPKGKPNIVGYQAKWEVSSFEYLNTPRTFDFNEEEAGLLDKLRDITVKCWNLFDLKGYARVDFRVDGDGKPYVLEVNANPCISSDSGFYAATQKAEIPFSEVIEKILNDCDR